MSDSLELELTGSCEKPDVGTGKAVCALNHGTITPGPSKILLIMTPTTFRNTILS